jgi:hypothetical protein
MNKYATIIAIEKYRDKSIPKLRFVETDGIKFKSVLLKLGFSEKKITYLLNDDATKTNVESELRKVLSRLTAKDEFIFFFSGHGFSKNDQNYITTFDTKKGDLENTSISLHFIFHQIRKCKSEKIIMFLDSCHSGLPIDDSMKDITTSMTDQELIEFFEESKYRIGFASCETDQSSYTAVELGHSIWTYHLIDVLNGNQSKLISREKFITASDLQNYLSIEVPKSVIKLTTDGIQNPVMFGNLSRDFIVADLTNIIEERKKARLTSSFKFDRALFSKEIIDSIKTLSGFKKHHKVPDHVTSSTELFVKNIAEEELKTVVEKVFSKIKNSFNYKRKDIKPEHNKGEGRIITPDFEFYIGINQSADDPAEYVERLECYNISSDKLVNSKEFNEVFSNYFDTIKFDLKNSINIEEIIDVIEEIEPENIKLNYPPDCSYCEILIDGLNSTIILSKGSLKIVASRRIPPNELLKSFINVRKELLKHKELKMLE